MKSPRRKRRWQLARQLLDRIARYTRAGKPEECWEWAGAVGGATRRPQIHWRGRTLYVARVVLAEKLGRPIRRRRLAVHSCDNGLCVNPAHLSEGSYSRNLSEAWDRLRRLRAIKAPTTLTAVEECVA